MNICIGRLIRIHSLVEKTYEFLKVQSGVSGDMQLIRPTACEVAARYLKEAREQFMQIDRPFPETANFDEFDEEEK